MEHNTVFPSFTEVMEGRQFTVGERKLQTGKFLFIMRKDRKRL
jgi:hypothetical protein